jgi:hypothetical protein
MGFTDIAPLDYYYAHGYQVMNPFYRIMAANPQYKYLVGRAIDNGNDTAANSVITKVLIDLKNTASPKGWDMMQLDETTMAAILGGDAMIEHRELVALAGGGPVPSERNIMQGYRQQVSNRLSELVDLLEDTREALRSKPRPGCAWVIRGDSTGMIRYLKTQGIEFPDVVAPSGHCYRFGKDWLTNQFFSTSDSDTLASLAQRALVWIIQIDPARTNGREGGAYLSEKEVLFPYEVRLHVEAGIDVASEADIGNLNLNTFGQPAQLRAKLLAVYRANRSSWPANKARFLVARESY